ncbi:MAG TPA: cache domain-containing protein, partial [Myxococcaceae bacterium]|nr:cache domain-containing protein [Myxococcaceae bacterium]
VAHGAALKGGARAQAEASVTRASAVMEHMSQDVQLRLRTEAQLMSEDPRLKSTLATPGIDEATIADVLQDLRKQTSAELLAVLTPTARVRAEVGASYLKGLDLSTSSVIRAAQAAGQPAVGTWVAGDQVLDVSAKAIRYDNQLVAYLVVGAPMTEKALQRVSQVTGAGVALIVAGKVTLGYPKEGGFPQAFAALAGEPAAFEAQTLALAGHEYIGQLTDVKNVMPTARLGVLMPAEDALAPFERARALAYVPTLVAVLFAAVAIIRGRLLR